MDEHKDAEDAVIMPMSSVRRASFARAPFKTALSISELEEPEESETKETEEEVPLVRCDRIRSSIDFGTLDHWWGMGPSIPDKRLEASMPGHVMTSEVCEVAVKKSDSISQLRDELPLGELCRENGKYVLLQMKLGKVSLLSLHTVVHEEAYEKLVGVGEKSLLNDALKLIVIPVNLSINVPVKGPKDADTIGSFFGARNVQFSRDKKVQGKYDIAMLSVDLYSVWSLRLLLPKVAFTAGRMVDFHIVSYRDNSSLASYRASMTEEVINQIQNLG